MEGCEEITIHNAEAKSRGENVNMRDELGWTPLMHAVYNGDMQLARDLLCQGAQVSLRNHHGITVFTIATLKFDEDLMKTLYDSLLPELKQQESNLALLSACTSRSYNTVEWLLDYTQAEVNTVSPLTGVTPLMLVAMSSGDCEISELLMKHGADPSLKSGLGRDVMEIALTTGTTKLFNIINPVSSTPKNQFGVKKIRNIESESIDPLFTKKHFNLDAPYHTPSKNSPSCPVIKINEENLSYRTIDKSLLSPSTRSVFLFSPQQGSRSKVSDQLNCEYNLASVVTPRKFISKSPSVGKKRKLSGVNSISSWFKKVTKRRSKSSADDDDIEDLYSRGQNGVDFLRVLKDLGLEEFFSRFKEEELDVWTFLSLTVQDLAAMGIDKPSSQIRILAGIQKLRTTQIY